MQQLIKSILTNSTGKHILRAVWKLQVQTFTHKNIQHVQHTLMTCSTCKSATSFSIQCLNLFISFYSYPKRRQVCRLKWSVTHWHTLDTSCAWRKVSTPECEYGLLREETPVSGRWPALPALHNVRKHCVSFLPNSTSHSPYFARESERRLSLTGTQDRDLNIRSGWTETQHSHSEQNVLHN